MTTTLTEGLTDKLAQLHELRRIKSECESEIGKLGPELVAELDRLNIEVPLPEIGQRANIVRPVLLVIPDMTRFYKLATRSIYNAVTSRTTNGSALRGCWDANVLGAAQKAVETVGGTKYIRFDDLQ